MDSVQFHKKMKKFEKIGKNSGNIIGKIIKNPFRFLAIVLSFMFVGGITFLYSLYDGVKES